MKILFTLTVILGISYLPHYTYAQLLNKLKNAVDNKVVEAVDKKLSDKIHGTSGNQNAGSPSGTGSMNGSGSGRAHNKGGEGLVTTPPDVKVNLADAEKSYKAGNYSQARQAVQQAMMGVEMEIGQKILKSLPETVSGLKKDPGVEQVGSSGWGWSGLTIQRQYSDEKEKEFRVIVANNTVMLAAVNLYLTNGGYHQTSGGEGQNWKQTSLKGHRAVIEYNDNSGYKLTVPIGQSSLVLLEGVNFKTEQEVMTAANAIDIDGIKKMLGEQ
jgi:hypothetical protein